MIATKDDQQKLPHREHAAFQKLIKYYDSKQFNPALSEAKTILKKFPNHGETISMKALIVHAQGKRDQADELAKEGLRNNFKSATCWHVIGILETKKKNHLKAMNAHQNALKNEPSNYIVMRDLAGLQHVLRKFKDYRNTRADIIPLKSAQNMSWISFALANYHCGNDGRKGISEDKSNSELPERSISDYNMAIEVLETMVDQMTKSKSMESEGSRDSLFRYDVSEIYLFLTHLFILQNKLEKAIEHLDKNEKYILDSISFRELKGSLYLKTNQHDLAQKEYTWLITRNPENIEYYLAFEMIIKPKTLQDRLNMFDIINSRFERALTGKRYILEFLPSGHEEFETRLKDYILSAIIKGRPALFQDLKSFYKSGSNNQGKVKVIESVLLSLLEDESIIKSCYPWACYYLTKHYIKLGQYDSALKYVNNGIEHTPTLVELYVVKAKVFRKQNELVKSVECIIEAQELDTADRFTNCLACKYLISNNEVERAEKMLAKFVKESQETGMQKTGVPEVRGYPRYIGPEARCYGSS